MIQKDYTHITVARNIAAGCEECTSEDRKEHTIGFILVLVKAPRPLSNYLVTVVIFFIEKS